MATVTIYSGTSDGGIFSIDAAYANARDGLGTLFPYDTDPDASVGQFHDGSAYYCGEAFLDFDTSGIVDTVTAATLSLASVSDNSDTDFIMEARALDWGASVTGADWQDPAEQAALPLLASFDTSSWSTSAYNEFTSEAAFPANIGASNTRIVVSSSRHRASMAPGASSYETINVLLAETSGTDDDPMLVIVTEDPPAASASPAGGLCLGLGLGPGLLLGQGGAGVSSFDYDLTAPALPWRFSNPRGSVRSYVSGAGELVDSDLNDWPLEYTSGGAARGRSTWPQQTNLLERNQTTGAATGTLTAGGSFGIGIGWDNALRDAMNCEILAVGEADGIPFVRFRIQNAAPGGTANARITFADTTDIAAAQTDVFTLAARIRLHAGALTNISNLRLRLEERSSGGGSLASQNQTITPDGAALIDQRLAGTGTMSNASTAFVQPVLRIDTAAGAYDATFDLALPHFVAGSVAGPDIAMDGAQATRFADAAELALPAGTWNITLTRSVGGDEAHNGESGTFAVPTDASDPIVTRIRGEKV